MSNRNGYVCIYKPSHHRADSTGMVYEHIINAEKHLGRELKSAEIVHHEDSCRSNNSKENLYVFTSSSEHTRYHRTGKRIKNEDGTWSSPKTIIYHICKQCEKRYIEKEKSSIYCSYSCTAKSNRRAVRPTKEELYLLLIENPNFTQVAEGFGVSDNAIRKWCRTYAIPSKTSEYKELSKLHT